ncbi:hypothetical protein [Ravibacter arvi]
MNDLFDGLDPELRMFMPDFDYVYHNLGEISDHVLRMLHNKFLAAALLALKHSVLKDAPKVWMPLTLRLADEAGTDLQTSLIIYIFVNSGLKREEILKVINMAPVTIKKTAMTTWDYLREEGRELGMEQKTEKAVRNLVKQSLLSDQQIASALEVSIEYVSGIRQKMKDTK